MKSVLILSMIYLVQCTSFNHTSHTICVKSSTGLVEHTSSHLKTICTEVCNSINNCSFQSQLPTVIALDSGDHVLSKSLELKGREEIEIYGWSTIIYCSPNVGLILSDNQYVSISNLTIVNCSTRHSSVYHNEISSAVFISRFKIVEITNINISQSSENGMTLISVCADIVVKESTFFHNSLGKLNIAKTGLNIEYDDCETTASDFPITQTLISYSKFIGNNKGNSTVDVNNDVFGGLFVTFNGNSSGISLAITECEFTGITGSGLSVHFINSSFNNSVVISTSYFADNNYPRIKSGNVRQRGQLYYAGGGGLRVMFDNYSSGNIVSIKDTNFIRNGADFGGGVLLLHSNASHDNTVNILSSNFSDNGIHGNPPKGGGGLSVLLMNSSHSNKVSIKGCHFIANKAIYGAGLHIQLRDSTCCNKLSIEKSIFSRNKSPNSADMRWGGGGGIDAGFYFFEKYAPVDNSIYICQCDFSYNKAYFGGGMLIYSSYAFRTNLKNNFHITNCLWQNNLANYGAAVDLSSKHLVHGFSPQGILPIPEFTNCTFINNEVVYEKNIARGTYQSSVGKGAFISTVMSARFLGTTVFEHCIGSAIHITSGYLIFGKHSNVTFSHNNGSTGGAIDLVGRSSILVNDHSRFSFIKNSALLNGGAISYFTTDKHSFVSFLNCFIEYIGEIKDIHERNIEFLFDGNLAAGGYSSIHATTIEHCLHTCNTSNYTTKPLNVFNCIANFTFLNGSNRLSGHQIATAGNKFKITSNNSFPLSVVPGWKFELPIIMVDELGNEVPAKYQLSLSDKKNSLIPTAYSILLKTNTTKIYGNPGNSVEMTVFHKDGLQETELIFNITFQSCPPGYVIRQVRDYIPYNNCICSSRFYIGIRCNYSASKAQLFRGYWVGYDRNKVPTEDSLVSGYCPEGYCNQHSKLHYSLPSIASREILDKKVCIQGRTGVLCGGCQANYSASYHGVIIRCLDNKQCSYGPVLYIILELLPITIMFIIIILFDVPFTSGAANGFILFSQVIGTFQVEANRFIWFPLPIYAINTASIRFIYKIFTLQFFTGNGMKGLEPLSFCLWKGSSALDMLAFHYVTLLYSLLLVVVTVKVINTFNIRKYCCECCFKIRRKRTVRGSITHGLTTFILLCYSRYAQVSLMILIPGDILDKNGEVIRKVVFYNGEVDFFSPTHMIYAIPALIICVILFLLPVLLFVYPAYYQVFSVFGIGESKVLAILCKVIPIEKLKPILDSFQGCFKDRYRFFAGLYFFYRLFAVISFAFTGNLKEFYLMVEVQLILMLMIHAFVQPYKKRWHNAIDVILLANLALINTLTAFNFNNSFSSKYLVISTTVQALLIWFPVIYMIVYIFWYILIKMCGIHPKLKCTCQLQSILSICSKYCKKKVNSDDYSDIELHSFYNTYED